MFDIDGRPGLGIALQEQLRPRRPTVSDFHDHDRHQLLGAAQGTLQLETERGQWFLFAGRAAWIAAHTQHRVVVGEPVTLHTVYLHPSLGPATPSCAVFPATELLRSTLGHAMRWRSPGLAPEAVAQDPAAQRFFAVLGDLVPIWLERADPFMLPRPEDPKLAGAMAWAVEHPAEATVPSLARKAGMSTRSLARHMKAQTGASPRSFLFAARMLVAMQRLPHTANITALALELGYDSPSAFTHAFRRFAGHAPREHAGR